VNREFRAMGTQWWLLAEGGAPEALAAAEALVHAEERRFSRFRAGSALSRLNRKRQVDDRRLAAVMVEALAFREGLGGAFDPAIGEAVLAAGYDRSFDDLPDMSEERPAPARGPIIRVDGDRVTLTGDGAVDLGGLAKGATVDRVGELLADAGCSRFVIDGGGDIVVGGCSRGREPEAIGLGAGGHAVRLTAGAVATSSALERRWDTPAGTKHHIITPRSGVPSKSRFAVATVVAPSGAVADAVATALVADPNAALPSLAAYGAEALLATANGEYQMTAGLAPMLV
jgi:thiamine biosynthesis lipoprotein